MGKSDFYEFKKSKKPGNIVVATLCATVSIFLSYEINPINQFGITRDSIKLVNNETSEEIILPEGTPYILNKDSLQKPTIIAVNKDTGNIVKFNKTNLAPIAGAKENYSNDEYQINAFGYAARPNELERKVL